MKSFLVKFGVVLGGLIIFGFAEVWGADWKLFAETDLYECFYDAEDIAPSPKNIVEVWARLEYTKKGVTGVVKQYGKHYEDLSYSLELWEMNCAEKKHRLLSTTAYSVEGNILYTDQAGNRPPPWKIISRKSVGESLYRALCR